MQKYLTELIGTFFLVLTVGCTGIAVGPGVIPPLAIGSVLMVMIYAGAPVSGGHYNPAVTLGVFLRGRCAVLDVVPYMVAQVIGALTASAAVMYLKIGAAAKLFQAPIGPGFGAEILFTFALVYVVLNVATTKNAAGNSYFGLAIGFTVLAGAFAVGDISGGAFNPAVAIGACMMGMLSWSAIWMYLVAEAIGGALAAVVFRVLRPDER
jgi:aquaporin Z